MSLQRLKQIFFIHFVVKQYAAYNASSKIQLQFIVTFELKTSNDILSSPWGMRLTMAGTLLPGLLSASCRGRISSIVPLLVTPFLSVLTKAGIYSVFMNIFKNSYQGYLKCWMPWFLCYWTTRFINQPYFCLQPVCSMFLVAQRKH